jgi:hypothetical protein
VKKDKLEYLTTYQDNTTSWQPKENFIREDGTITAVMNKYYKHVDKPKANLYVQLEKYNGLFKSPKVPLQTAIYQLLGIFGKKSTYLSNPKAKEYFHSIFKNIKSMNELQEFTARLLEEWTKWIDTYETERKIKKRN